MKKIITSIAMLLVLGTAQLFAQSNEYQQLTKELIQMGTSSYSPQQIRDGIKESVQGALSGIMDMLPEEKKSNLSDVNTLLDNLLDSSFGDYFTGGDFINDMASVMEPVYEKSFTVDELKQIDSIYKSDKGKAMLERSVKCVTNINSATSQLVKHIMQIATTGLVPEVEKVDCPATYREVFDKYFNLTMGSSLDSLKEQFAGNSDPNGKRLADYMVKALPETVLRMYYPAVTLDEMKANVDFVSDPLIKRYVSVNADPDPSTMQSINQKILSRLGDLQQKFSEIIFK